MFEAIIDINLKVLILNDVKALIFFNVKYYENEFLKNEKDVDLIFWNALINALIFRNIIVWKILSNLSFK